MPRGGIPTYYGVFMSDTIKETSQPEEGSVDWVIEKLQVWQQTQVEYLKHMSNVPVGTEVEITTPDDPNLPTINVVMEGQFLAGFQLGLELAIKEFSTFPFKKIAEVVEDVNKTN